MTDTTLPGVLLHGVAGSRPAANAVAKGTVYSATDTGAITQSDGVSTWSTWATIAAAGSVATDAIWTTAGDLAVGTGASTAARKGIGAAGAALSVINAAVAWNSGTSMPGAKATGDRYWRTDLGMEFYWDGTRWLSTQLFAEPFGGVRKLLSWAVSSPNPDLDNTLMTLDNDLWVVACYVSAGFSGTNNGSNYWTFTFGTFDTSGSSVTALGNVTTAADTQGNVTRHKLTVGALAGTTATYIQMEGSWTGTPGSIFAWGMFTYRIVGT